MIVVVRNKYDNYEFEQVEDIQGKHLAKQFNGMFHSTSAKTGQGIEELFQKIGKQCVNNEMTLMSQTMKQEVSLYSNKLKLQKVKKKDKAKKRKFC